MGARDRHMVPLTVSATLMSAPIIRGPMLLDGILVGAVGAYLGRGAPGGIKSPDHVYGQLLPLARIYRGGECWWYAASQVTPAGAERPVYTRRRVAYDVLERWTAARSVNHSSGPDKAIQSVSYRRPDMTRLQWTCVGDPAEIGRLLCYVESVGRLTTHGHGWVLSWSVLPGGPELGKYSQDVTLRHIPVSALRRRPRAPGVMIRQVPVHPPYHRRRKAVPCYQVVR